jgi:hypothetical protein
VGHSYPIADYLKANLGFSGIQLLTYEETQPFHKRNPNIVGIILIYQKRNLQELSTKDTVFNQFWQKLEYRAENIHFIYFTDRLPEEWFKKRTTINLPEPLDIEIPPEFDIDDVDIFDIYF